MRLRVHVLSFVVLSSLAAAAGAVESKEVLRRSIPLAAGVRTVAVDNVFGSVAVRAGAVDRVNGLLREILEELDLSYAVLERGLTYDIGSGGRRLSLSQRQQLGMARVLLRNPEFLIVNHGLNALDNRTVEKIIQGILAIAGAKAGGFGVLWITSTDSHAANFERVLRFERGALVSDESPAPEMAAQ